MFNRKRRNTRRVEHRERERGTKKGKKKIGKSRKREKETKYR